MTGTKVVVTQASWDNGHTEYRVVTDEPSAAYVAWVEAMLGTEVDGEREYEYDEGIAP